MRYHFSLYSRTNRTCSDCLCKLISWLSFGLRCLHNVGSANDINEGCHEGAMQSTTRVLHALEVCCGVNAAAPGFNTLSFFHCTLATLYSFEDKHTPLSSSETAF